MYVVECYICFNALTWADYYFIGTHKHHTMKKQFLFSSLLTLAFATFFLSACTETPKERRQDAVLEAKEDLKDANADVAAALRAERDDLSAKMDKASRELDAEIMELDQKIEKATAKEKVKWQERRKNLAQQRDELNADMKQVGNDMKDSWSDFKVATARKLDKISADLKED